MLARRLPGILPPLTFDEALECTAIHSVAGALPAGVGLLRDRPFRAPHHTISDVALVGGGTMPRPGEISLAHHGVLFLDEMPEFSRHVLDVLRQPLEEGRITVARAARTVTFPARFVLVAAMNPCPCGYRGDPGRACRCTPQQVARYRGRLSGPLLDRIDLIVDVQPVADRRSDGPSGGEPSAAVRGARAGGTRQADEPAGARGAAQRHVARTRLRSRVRDRRALAPAARTIGGTPAALGARISPGSEGGADDCRPRRRNAHRAPNTWRRRCSTGWWIKNGKTSGEEAACSWTGHAVASSRRFSRYQRTYGETTQLTAGPVATAVV